MKDNRKFSRIPILLQTAYVIWIFFQTWQLSQSHINGDALFFGASLAVQLMAVVLIFLVTLKKGRIELLLLPFFFWMLIMVGGQFGNYHSPAGGTQQFEHLSGEEKKLLRAAGKGSAQKILGLQEKYHYSPDFLKKAMHQALVKDNREMFQAAEELGIPLDRLNPEDLYFQPWIHQAVMEEALDVMAYLLERGISVDSTGPLGMTALMVAAYEGKPRAVEFLISQRADLEVMNNRGFRAIDLSVMDEWDGPLNDRQHIVEVKQTIFDQLVQAGSAKEALNPYSLTLLDLSGNWLGDHLESLGYKHGAETFDYGETLLHQAAEKGDLQLIREIMDEGAIPIDYGSWQEWRSPLFFSLYNQENTAALKLLVDRGTDVNLPDREGLTPLMYGCSHITESSEPLQYLLDHGADPLLESDEGLNALDYLTDNPHLDFSLWKEMIQRGIPVDSAVMAKAVKSWFETKDFILNRDQDLTPSEKKVKLSANDAGLAWIWEQGEGAIAEDQWDGLLMAAASYSNLPCFRIALAHGGNPDFEDRGVSVVQRILIEDGIELMKSLVENHPRWQNLPEDHERLNCLQEEAEEYVSFDLLDYFTDMGA